MPCMQSAPATFKIGLALRALALECSHIKGLCSVVFMLIACKEAKCERMVSHRLQA